MSQTFFHLFSYGTLRRGEAAAELMSDCERVSSATVHGTLYDAGDFPALVLGGDDPVQGDIWRCPAGLLPHLDRYEGVAEGLFRRVGVEVEGTACWVYIAGPTLWPRLRPEARIEPTGGADG